MRAYVDQDVCIGCGLCASTCPEVFEMNDEGKAEAVADTTDENRDGVLEAIENCPVSAIREQE
ncbi:MAG: ferredoxin [Mobilibacterium timonense]|uniref:ferredoxin n=1 Tax=Mobilibacterium timonense TaxID=1871012 RepID=UPI002356E9E8|nr:ferredoxin [Mobilibacterium timonense]MBM6989910.1 ferredoxin [Mobilibacterium timonense]